MRKLLLTVILINLFMIFPITYILSKAIDKMTDVGSVYMEQQDLEGFQTFKKGE